MTSTLPKRTKRALTAASALVPLAVAAVIAPAGSTASAGGSNGHTLKITSTLDGKTVLPHRIHWLAFPKTGRSKVSKVDFLIDGKVRWIERKAPYSYSDDDGYLVTSWLSPGRHRFTVRAIASDGRRVSHTVVARVLPAADPPAALAGTWQRNVDTSNAPKPGTAANPTETPTPAGTYTITFEKRWIHDRFPGKFTVNESIRHATGEGEEFDSDWTPASNTFHVQGAVTFRVFHENTDQEGGSWCYWDGPGADYSWSVSGTTLTLTPAGGRDACGIRGFIWSGDWTRVG